ncbi:MAG: PQQ-dependent sugar dehydrogenase [Xanthomonadales bacterium]|nr:PQQ-dependent sugar dehydrogenase [Xanthomonadales bacterium]
MRTTCGFLGLLAASLAWSADLPLDKIRLPEGFKIEVYADNVPNARQMAWGDRGVLFVGSRREGKVYAVVDGDDDHRADAVHVLASGLTMPSGLAFRDGDLYVGDIGTIYRLDGIEDRLSDPPELQVVTDAFPKERHHGWKYLGFGPDGKLYVPVGAPCNICLEEDFAEIRRINPDGSGMETIARGVRNSVGFDWHPDTGDLWFTDNGRDMMGDNLPPCELNHLSEVGQHFGYPFCHGATVPDPEFGQQRDCDEFRPPAQPLGPHVAPLGMKFYTGSMFPAPYRGRVFIAEHGSWNRSSKIGYRVTMVTLGEDQEAIAYETFAEGWLQGEENWGRPADIQLAPDGSMLVADDQAGVIYRISFEQ